MSKKIAFIVFAVILLSVPLYLMINSERVLEDGHRHKIRLRAYDPFDPFRGKYLRLNYDNNVLCDENLEKGEAIYITLEKDSLGFSHFAYGAGKPPENSTDYFKSTVLWRYDGTATFKTDNISKYFINEDKATPAETIVQNYQRNHPTQIYIAIRVLDGEIRLEDIYVEETPLLEFLEK